jgi:hypothetical protein
MKFILYASSSPLLRTIRFFILSAALFLVAVHCPGQSSRPLPRVKVSENSRFLITEKKDPFFWLGDTGWLLFSKLTREEASQYLETRKAQGFNVIQVMVLHSLRGAVNVYGDSALINGKADQPKTTPGNSFSDPVQYDYWDHLDYIIDLAGSKGIYMALVPVWGSNVRGGLVTREQAGKYAGWLAERYMDRNNVIWVNGGDVRGDDSLAIWNLIGSTIRKITKNQLITYHPFGRTQSSTWFHNEAWLDMNMFQSGHRSYDQDKDGISEDNWRYVASDYARVPVKPTLDGEPSYEGIPHGLHDASQPYWTDADVRRYAYWSVFAGGGGFTYGSNAVMQFYKPGDANPAYGAKKYWTEAINDPGASQMRYLKKLILSKSYFDRVPANELLDGPELPKYDYIAITKGKNYVMAYTWNGSIINLNTGKLPWKNYKASWFNPRNGEFSAKESHSNAGIARFVPPGGKAAGNDWVLIIDKN